LAVTHAGFVHGEYQLDQLRLLKQPNQIVAHGRVRRAERQPFEMTHDSSIGQATNDFGYLFASQAG
jgi:hypothetical protein